MLKVSGRDHPDSEETRVFVLEFAAAFAILSILTLVLYMVLSGKPA